MIEVAEKMAWRQPVILARKLGGGGRGQSFVVERKYKRKQGLRRRGVKSEERRSTPKHSE